MPCLLGCLILLFPRVAIVLIYLTSSYLQHAYTTLLWPLLGFLFMPLTTLAYAYAMNNGGSVQGFNFLVVLVAIILDLGLHGGSEWGRRRYQT